MYENWVLVHKVVENILYKVLKIWIYKLVIYSRNIIIQKNLKTLMKLIMNL